jgi:hypothetical protein
MIVTMLMVMKYSIIILSLSIYVCIYSHIVYIYSHIVYIYIVIYSDCGIMIIMMFLSRKLQINPGFYDGL